MRFNLLFVGLLLILTVILTGCPSAPTPSNAPANAPGTNTAVNAPTNNNSTISTSPAKTPEATTNAAPTLKPVFTAYCDAMTKKDDAALRKVFSAATIKKMEVDMKEEKAKSLADYLAADGVSNKLCEVTNEKIDGDVGVALVKTEGAPNGFKIKFIKENGEWKLTTDIPDFEEVKQASKSANTAK